MFGTYFYNERIRRSVALFGSLFNNINILRKNSKSTSTSQIRVPLSYAPKRKFLEEINQRNKNDLHDDKVIAITLPRMSFEIVGMNYDPSRQLPKTNSCVIGSIDGDQSNRTKLFTKTPYNIQFQLNIYSKNHDDALQVIEQIWPYFTPQFTIPVKPLDDFPNIIDDVPIVLNATSFSDDYEGTIEQRRTIIYTLDFEMKLDLYGPSVSSPIIETADVSFFLDNLGSEDNSGFTKYSILSVTTDPSPVSADSDFDFVETITFTQDSG